MYGCKSSTQLVSASGQVVSAFQFATMKNIPTAVDKSQPGLLDGFIRLQPFRL